MIRLPPYRCWMFLALLCTAGACKPTINKAFTLNRRDQIPYGTSYAFQNLHYIFSQAEISASGRSPENFYSSGGGDAYIIIGHQVRPSEKELKAMLAYAEAGNHIFISATHIGSNLLDSFRLSASQNGFRNQEDSLTVSVLLNHGREWRRFSYPGLPTDDAFVGMDSSITGILGENSEGKANFIRLNYEHGGSVILHLAPAALTNFFLLHKDNKQYYDRVMSALPDTIRHITWDDYFRHHINGADDSARSGFSALSLFLNHPVLRWAFWLTVILFAIIYLFESKRKQRVMPVIAQLRNASLDFATTIGRLYFQRHDNRNLAQKMGLHFLSHVRTRYNLSAGQAGETFEQKLSFKSGYPLERIRTITGFIREADAAGAVSDADLLSFSYHIDQFYKQT